MESSTEEDMARVSVDTFSVWKISGCRWVVMDLQLASKPKDIIFTFPNIDFKVKVFH